MDRRFVRLAAVSLGLLVLLTFLTGCALNPQTGQSEPTGFGEVVVGVLTVVISVGLIALQIHDELYGGY